MPIKRSCILLFTLLASLSATLPAAALAAPLAAPVAVITRSSGTTTANDTILAALGLNSVPTTAPLPYALTLRSTFDADSGTGLVTDYGGDVVVDFQIGGQTFHYNGIGNSSAMRDSVSIFDNYEQHIWFDTPGPPNANYTVHFYNKLHDLPGSMGQSGPLTPFAADQNSGKDVFGSYAINAYPSNPDVPLSWNMGGAATALSVQVAVVPEPAAFGLLAAGLLTLGLRRRPWFSLQKKNTI